MVVQSDYSPFVEVNIPVEQFHFVEAVGGSRVAGDIEPISDSDILIVLVAHRAVVVCQKEDIAGLNQYHKECDEKAEPAEILRQPEPSEGVHRPMPEEVGQTCP